MCPGLIRIGISENCSEMDDYEKIVIFWHNQVFEKNQKYISQLTRKDAGVGVADISVNQDGHGYVDERVHPLDGEHDDQRRYHLKQPIRNTVI